jgi:hypothetical protein
VDSLYCPIIKEVCKKENCVMWIEDNCSAVELFHAFVKSMLTPEEDEMQKKERIFKERQKYVESQISVKILNNTPEEIAALYLSYMEEIFPDEFDYKTYGYFDSFLGTMNINRSNQRWLSGDIKIKLQKAESIAENISGIRRDEINNKRIEEENKRFEEAKERLPKLIQNCVEWARAKGMSRVTVADVEVFTLEYDLDLNYKTSRALYAGSNVELKSRPLPR